MLKKYLTIFFVSMVPIIELRGAMPMAMGMDLNYWLSLALCVLGNMIPVPFIYFFARKILIWGAEKKYIGKFFRFCLTKGEKAGKKLAGSAGRGGLLVSLMLFVAIPNDNSATLFFRLSRIFMTMTFLVLLGTLIVTIIIVQSTVKPLRQMARAARSYSRGDFSVRVPLPKREDELYEMSLSFNNMANAMENIETNRRTMMASVSHDLRTPMTTIGGFVDGILDGTIRPEQQRQYLEIISEEVKRLTRMANSLLSISRLEDGNALRKTPFDFSEMVRRIIIGFEKQLEAKEIEGDLTIPESLTVVADHDALFQVVYNLMDNALKFIDQGGTLTIYLEETGGKARFHIINTGSEIPADQLPYIFERFYKGDSARTGVKNGSGLGLYIVKTVINKHGGDVYAKSSGGKTEFCFSLPIGKP